MLTGAFTTAMTKYIPNNLNDGHLEYFYYLCIAFVVIFIPINFICFSYFDEFDEQFIESLGNPPSGSESDALRGSDREEEAGVGEVVNPAAGRLTSDALRVDGASDSFRPSARSSSDHARYSFGMGGVAPG